ncbi:hypothetical protein BDA96_08G088400 [Sorghum bicolor]|uniref:Knottins-like domain-containing protein n=2 Tax=Sorghum bicolor TaxID=4558 RepID=A0A921QF87_SORBI|nr:hypothetical protein BDA96_08G088400 [Sorghum bicolor]KXG23312.1 hypothetical protein SORBI_3008G082300 [Sorghum bicolor]
MAYKKVVLGLFTLALFLVAHYVEAVDVCTTRNWYFYGPCMSNKNCAASCIQHGIGGGGYCSPWRRCKCTLQCPWRKMTLAGIGLTHGRDKPEPLDKPSMELFN